MKHLVIPIFLTLLHAPAHAASTASLTFPVGAPVPDNNAVGLSSTQSITSTIGYMTEVKVQIALSGGWSGDLYAYLTHGSGFSVLLNRPGRSLLKIDGSGANPLAILFADGAALDIHNAIPDSGAVSGTYQPDAREMDPTNCLDTSPRTAFLSSFNGLDANGDWTLYVADLATGDTMTLESWTLTLQGVPEPGSMALALLGIGLAMHRRRVA
jgi:subtilisin-like proprotein convertase family protein